MSKWTSRNMPSQIGRSVVVTGTGGLGFEDALALAKAGAEVIIAGRNAAKGSAAVAAILYAAPSANVKFEVLDLASLRSVADFASRLRNQRQSLDVLINNAGVMNPPQRQTTEDGYELQLGTNYLAHFALTAHLMPLLRQGRNSRVVTLSSIAARAGAINFEDLQSERGYRPMTAYGQSKLACLMFAFELQRRSDAAGLGVASLAAHPGISRTDLLPNGAGRQSAAGLARRALWFLFQPAAQGALPTLFAATSPAAKAGGYYGPDGLAEARGAPTIAKAPPQSEDLQVAARLWSVAEQLTGARFT
jgi:NAD(P)-dependent dehydrogenase (short-subunit alcohol dehydrogenase family)